MSGTGWDESAIAPYAWVYGKQDRWFHRDYGAWHEIPEPWFARVRSELNRKIRAGLVAGGLALPAPQIIHTTTQKENTDEQ